MNKSRGAKFDMIPNDRPHTIQDLVLGTYRPSQINHERRRKQLKNRLVGSEINCDAVTVIRLDH